MRFAVQRSESGGGIRIFSDKAGDELMRCEVRPCSVESVAVTDEAGAEVARIYSDAAGIHVVSALIVSALLTDGDTPGVLIKLRSSLVQSGLLWSFMDFVVDIV